MSRSRPWVSLNWTGFYRHPRLTLPYRVETSAPGPLRPAGVGKAGSEVLTWKLSRFPVKSSREELLFLAASFWLEMHPHTLEDAMGASSLLPPPGALSSVRTPGAPEGTGRVCTLTPLSPCRHCLVACRSGTGGVRPPTDPHRALGELSCRTRPPSETVWPRTEGEEQAEVCVWASPAPGQGHAGALGGGAHCLRPELRRGAQGGMAALPA